MKFPFDCGYLSNVELVLGRRKWAWLLPLPSDWQLVGLGDGTSFAVNDQSVCDHDWPPYNVTGITDESDDGEGVLFLLSNNRQQGPPPSSQARRVRRDSEGYILPAYPISYSDPIINV